MKWNQASEMETAGKKGEVGLAPEVGLSGDCLRHFGERSGLL